MVEPLTALQVSPVRKPQLVAAHPNGKTTQGQAKIEAVRGA
jgi:hypothetical protein